MSDLPESVWVFREKLPTGVHTFAAMSKPRLKGCVEYVPADALDAQAAEIERLELTVTTAVNEMRRYKEELKVYREFVVFVAKVFPNTLFENEYGVGDIIEMAQDILKEKVDE